MACNKKGRIDFGPLLLLLFCFCFYPASNIANTMTCGSIWWMEMCELHNNCHRRPNQKVNHRWHNRFGPKIISTMSFSIYGPRKYWMWMRIRDQINSHHRRHRLFHQLRTILLLLLLDTWLMITADNGLFLSFPQNEWERERKKEEMFIVYITICLLHDGINCLLFVSITSGHEIKALFRRTTWLLLLLLTISH